MKALFNRLLHYLKGVHSSEINLHPEYLLGVATNTIINNEFGYVTCFGKINEISTSAWTLVQPILYFDFNNGGLLWFRMLKKEIKAIMPVKMERKTKFRPNI